MSSTMKISLLALVSTVVAVPHYGANPHNKFHGAKAAQGTAPYGAPKPYPTAGWPGAQNGTAAVPYPTGSYPEDKTTTIDETSTSTQTLYSTVIVKASSAGVVAENVPTGQCGPATVTITAKEKVTVTVTPGGGAGYTPAPQSSAAPVESKHNNGYGASSQAPVAEKSSVTPAAEYPAATPEAATSTTPAAEYPAETPEASKATSSKAEYVAPSYAQNKPIVSASSAAPSASATPPSSGNTYSGAKRGLAYNTAELCKSFAGKFGFGYNWGQIENNDIGTNFIPMMHKPTDSSAKEWLANVNKAVEKGSIAVMGFNECDHAEQCNMSPEAACASWKEYMNPIKTAHPDVTIIGPSVTNGGAPMGIDWLSRFHDSCPDATVDATNIHFYDIYEEGQTLDRFKAQVEKAADLYGKPVWVTEFGLNPGSASSDQAVTFLKGAMEYLDNSAHVQGYSWFMVGTGENQLNTASGLSPIGEAYAS
ncbi:glycoside hydrolase family 128 protein [Plenodomus tracheiphilus IPT5]|uniref:Glycoside hydrolase family 128 protein n=1 Tax=Plenodomus tracheiphilus IPT5 TaxID=1408161 RepID=A0A6A7BE85_9PLEO|nr:glycoside hydrolase family 128 protein [Plenodomus tracheiphilus IPT5]